jgi:hypothetical protein
MSVIYVCKYSSTICWNHTGMNHQRIMNKRSVMQHSQFGNHLDDELLLELWLDDEDEELLLLLLLLLAILQMTPVPM